MGISESNKKKIDQSVTNKNVSAFLMAIRHCEGTSRSTGYKTLFGGKLFSSFADHPNIKVPYKNTYSTAAGAYQFLYRTWLKHKVILGLPDFSPASQDKAAINEIREKSALQNIIDGKIDLALDKVKKVWASLPGAGYNQPEKTAIEFKRVYLNNGGFII